MKQHPSSAVKGQDGKSPGIAQRNDLCIAEIAEIIGTIINTVSQKHLKNILDFPGKCRRAKDGSTDKYSLLDN